MTEIAERLKSELARLTRQDRLDLAQFLIDSLDDGVDADAEAAWDAELARRLAEIKCDTSVGEPADQVFAGLRKKYS